MGGIVTEAIFDISITLNEICARSRPNSRTHPFVRGNVGVAWSLRHVNRTIESPVMELIDHQSFECVRDWVEVIDPSEPRMHILNRDRKPSVYDQSKHKDGLSKFRSQHSSCQSMHEPRCML